jgi:hypothetical protein
MSELNRIRELAGLPAINENSRVSWNVEDDGMYITATWQGSLGPIEFVADGLEFGDGYWKIYINEAGYGNDTIQPIAAEDLDAIKTVFVEWFQRAKNVDFGDDSILPVNDVQVHMPKIKGALIKQFAASISQLTKLKMLSVDMDAKEVVMDFRNTPIPYADQYKDQQLGKEENPYKTDTM